MKNTQMIAHHPVTGKEVRILKSEASLWKEKKTLAWIEPGGVSPWGTVSSGKLAGGWPDFLLWLRPESPAEAAQHVKVVFVEKRIESIPNCMSLGELSEAYPHLGAKWDGTQDDAVVMIAGLLRYRRIAGAWSPRAESLGLVREMEPPARLWWVTQYYKPSDPKRARELAVCLDRNLASQRIDRVVLLNEKKEGIRGEKVSEVVIGSRLTYKAVLEWISTSVPSDVIVAFANADICIDDESWKDLWSVNMEGKFLALLRYDVPESGRIEEAELFGPRADSQDTWVVRAEDVKKRTGWAAMDIPFGKMGCDNAIALEMFRAKFLIVNPAFSLKTWHFHASGVRNYVRTDVVEKPIFLYLSPTGFHDLQPILKWSELAAGELTEADGRAAIQLGSCFGTAGGLVFDRQRMIVGPGKEAQEVWAATEVHGLTPSLECKKGVIVPWPGGAEESREVYVQRYLSRVLRLRSVAGWEDAEFLCPEESWAAEALSIFKWGVSSMPVMKYDEEVQTWYRRALVYPVMEGDTLCAEDVAALRRGVRGWSDTVGERKRLILVQGGALTEALVGRIEEMLEDWTVQVVYVGRSSADRMRDLFVGAWGVVCAGGSGTGWNWLLPRGAQVFELAVGTGKNLEGAMLSVVSDLSHSEVRVRAGMPVEAVAAQIVQEVLGAGSGSATGPVIWMPKKVDGYFGHPGDSFREMVRLWRERGWIQVREHDGTLIWWGEVGERGVLLYDRPNHDWRLAAPASEQKWRRALFGNPKPPADSDSVPWSFWARRPELVEAMTVGGWEERTRRLVFYGKIENKVQERRRPADWSSACADAEDEWVLVRGEQAYPFTQQQYLERLATARFGLCLAGYGYKCHREVECMAMGCVPLVAPDVDMDSYAVPPREGIEYLRVAGPAAAAEAAKMDRSTWERMSAAGREWWKANASCEGMFQLTKKLVEK